MCDQRGVLVGQAKALRERDVGSKTYPAPLAADRLASGQGRENAGCDRDDADTVTRASSRAAGKVKPTTPPFDAL